MNVLTEQSHLTTSYIEFYNIKDFGKEKARFHVRSSRVVIMNIIIAAAVIIAALFFRMKYRPQGQASDIMFGVCAVTSVVMLLGTGTFSLVSMLFYLCELTICSVIVLAYRRECRCQAAQRARKTAAARRAAQERAAEQARRRTLSSYAAFTDVYGEAA